MVIDKSIKRVTVGNTDIQRIMSGGGILWQAKTYKISWESGEKYGDAYIETNKVLYYNFILKNGKIIGKNAVDSNPRNNLGKVIYIVSDIRVTEIKPFELDEGAYHFIVLRVGRVVEYTK